LAVLGAAFFVTAAFLAGDFFAAGLELFEVVRAAFSVILLSHASISASSETGETVIAGSILGSDRAFSSLATEGADFFFDFFEVSDERSAFAVADQLMRLKFLKKC
jgi:hypothetical protein